MPSYKKSALAVPRAFADDAIRALLRAGVLDPTRKIRDTGDVLIPVHGDEPSLAGWASRLGARIVDDAPLAEREGRRSPHEGVVAALAGTLPSALLALVPDKWEQHGDVLVLRLPPELRAHERIVAEAFARELRLKSVLDDAGGVEGELREMRACRIVWGSDPVATHVENQIAFRFDASRIMFSSGNVHERMRAAKLPAKGETVVDMFAGIGYFALPLAVHAGAASVIALEKNPVSFRYLVENATLNGVENVVDAWCGDNREFPREGIADRVLMGYFPKTRAFLPKAFALLKPSGGVIHYHDTSHERVWKDEMTRAVLEASRACGRVVAIRDARVVKSHSPGVVHAALDVDVRG